MSNETKYTGGNDSGSGDLLLVGLIAGVALSLAGYGLYKLVSSESDSRRSIAGRSEHLLLEDMINGNM